MLLGIGTANAIGFSTKRAAQFQCAKVGSVWGIGRCEIHNRI
jgi:hypothetical protein